MRWVTSVIVVVALVAAAGCSRQGAPALPATSVAETPSQTPTGSASPSGPVTPTVGQTVSVPEVPAPVLPAMPPEAQEMTNEGAEAFVVYWFDLANYALATGDTEPMMTLVMTGCSSCVDMETQVAANYANGGRILGNTWTLSDVSVTQRQGDVFAVHYSFDRVAGVSVDADGVVRQLFPADSKVLGAVLQYSDGVWRLAEITIP